MNLKGKQGTPGTKAKEKKLRNHERGRKFAKGKTVPNLTTNAQTTSGGIRKKITEVTRRAREQRAPTPRRRALKRNLSRSVDPVSGRRRKKIRRGGNARCRGRGRLEETEQLHDVQTTPSGGVIMKRAVESDTTTRRKRKWKRLHAAPTPGTTKWW